MCAVGYVSKRPLLKQLQVMPSPLQNLRSLDSFRRASFDAHQKDRYEERHEAYGPRELYGCWSRGRAASYLKSSGLLKALVPVSGACRDIVV